MEVIFVPAPHQSALLQQTGLVATPPLTDQQCLLPGVVTQRLEAASAYHKRVKFDVTQDRATVGDLVSAEKAVISTVIAANLHVIQRNLAPVNAQAVANLIMQPITAQFVNVNAQFANVNAQLALVNAQIVRTNLQLQNMQAMSHNIHAELDGDTILHKVTIPNVQPLIPGQPYPGLPEPAPLPPNFPATRGELLQLTGPQIAPFMIYYGIGYHGVTLRVKRSRLARFLGLPHWRL